jgi:hypothetical protein
MSNTVINLAITDNGSALELDEPPKFATSDYDYGIKRVDNDQVVVVSDTCLNENDLGNYTYTFADPSTIDSNTQYRVSFSYVYNGETTYKTAKIFPGTINFNLSIPSTRYFSSETEVLRMLGKFGVDLITEDIGNTSYIWEEVLSYVDETIYQYIDQFYDSSSLKSNKFLRRRATILAAHYLSQRRGNPALYLREATSIRDELESLRSGRIHIPGAIPRGNLGPVVRNYVMQPFRHTPQRVQKYKSTGDDYPNQKISYEPYLFMY